MRLRRAIRVLLLAGGSAAVIGAAALLAWLLTPLPADMREPGAVPSVTLLDRSGRPLRTTRAEDGSRGGWIDFDDIDPEIIQAFLAAEDRRFFQHHGIDALAVARAAYANLRNGRIVSGASTLTMQTARLLRPMPRTWPGKLRQALWALRLEAQLDKSQILETYLNRVPLGQGAVGVAAATRLYFGARANEVSLAQAAMLAGLAHLPSRENPLVAPTAAERRRNAVLARMQELGYATAADVERAVREPVLSPESTPRFAAPHFTTQLLLRLPNDAVGRIRTTLDLALQDAVESEVRHAIATLEDRKVHHGAAVVLDNRSGDILAWVGSPDFFADSTGQVDMVVSRRQPGSTLKPFLFGLALENGFTAASVLPDVPRTWMTSTGPYQPQNYDRRFRGPVRLREALASSYNVPAVDLASRLGPERLLHVLHEAGFASLDRSAEYYGLGLALGNGEVTLLELANAYRGLAAGGVWRPVRWVQDGYEAGAVRSASRARPPEPASRRFLSTGAAVMVLDILSDPVARIPGFGEQTPFDLPFPAAAKTGTSRHFTDNWAVLTTGGFTVAVWVGNFSGQPMQGVSGIAGAGPLVYRIALRVAARFSPGTLPPPEAVGAEPAEVCALSGLLATPDCPSLIEWFLPGTKPEQLDDWQVGGTVNLPPEYAEWLALSANSELAGAPAAVATDGPELVSPRDGDVYEIPPGAQAEFATLPLVATPADGVRWFIDTEPFEGARWPLVPGEHEITAVFPNGERLTAKIRVERLGARVSPATRGTRRSG